MSDIQATEDFFNKSFAIIKKKIIDTARATGESVIRSAGPVFDKGGFCRRGGIVVLDNIIHEDMIITLGKIVDKHRDYGMNVSIHPESIDGKLAIAIVLEPFT